LLQGMGFVLYKPAEDTDVPVEGDEGDEDFGDEDFDDDEIPEDED